MRTLLSRKRVSYLQITNLNEIDNFIMEGFNYFKEHIGILDYKKFFKAWMRRFPRPILIFAILRGLKVIGWATSEELEDPDLKAASIFVLRGIEILKQYRRKKIGSIIVALISAITPGHLITKPINKEADFFSKA